MTVDWADAASRLLKAEIAKKGLTLAELAQRLQALGCQETEASIKNKLYRGTFAMTFFMQCLQALDATLIEVASVLPVDVPRGNQLTQIAKG
jgi:hypothetical protein